MRKALVGLMMAATAITPIASAYAQDQGGERQRQRSEWQAQRAERQAQRAERQAQRTEQQVQRPERQVQRPERQMQRSEAQIQRSENRMQRFERRTAPPQVQQDSEQVRTRQWSGERVRSDRSRTDGMRRFERRQAPSEVVQQSPEVQTRQRWQSDRNRTDSTRTYQRRDRDGDRSWDGNRTDSTRTYQRRDRDGDRSWDGNRTRSGSWDGRSYRWNRDGRTYSWNSDWRRDRRYDWQNYRRSNRFIFNIGSYYAPYRNYSYRRFSIGYFLEPLFFSNNYWIDSWQYRLPPAYPGTRWVRYYDDVLLVDIYTGEVIDVIYDFFW